jgi:hypothetical protein
MNSQVNECQRSQCSLGYEGGEEKVLLVKSAGSMVTVAPGGAQITRQHTRVTALQKSERKIRSETSKRKILPPEPSLFLLPVIIKGRAHSVSTTIRMVVVEYQCRH